MDICSTNRRQYQWFFQTSPMDPARIPFVSGRNRAKKTVMIITTAAKSKNTPYLRWQNMAKDIWARTNVRAKLEAMQIACPAGRTSRGSISLGMIQVRGPHDHPNAALMLHMRTSMATAPVLESAAVPESPTSDAIMTFLGKHLNRLSYLTVFLGETIWLSGNDAGNSGSCSRYGGRNAATPKGVFFNGFFVLYLLSPKLAHRIVGYLEEEAIHSYTEYLRDIDDGKIENVPAPAISIDYWRLPKDATLKDVITVIRADEAHHRDVNHFASVNLYVMMLLSYPTRVMTYSEDMLELGRLLAFGLYLDKVDPPPVQVMVGCRVTA
ncbi:hypothetical protein RHGRI_032339 [Rhododendron griersonianum]|uniref:Ubiquinol oxidase n=1 Tax=Rhododendron griersonianum TaxID=479676 RepID=A0AAV6IDU8_9ERIC|nr:hypothetical protein RHGRI_032339 [Rhododendron griersonianum]